MSFNKILKKLIIPAILAIAITPVASDTCVKAEEKEQNDPQMMGPMCYDSGPPRVINSYTLDELKEQLTELDKLYKEDKIDKKTHDIRKKDIKKRMEEINALNESSIMEQQREYNEQRFIREGDDNNYN